VGQIIGYNQRNVGGYIMDITVHNPNPQKIKEQLQEIVIQKILAELEKNLTNAGNDNVKE